MDGIKTATLSLKSKIGRRPELLVYAYFFIAALFLAVIIRLGVGPDETVHYHSIRYYAENSHDPFIQQQTGSYDVGDITRNSSYLYYYLMSFVYRFAEVLGASTYGALRVVNILLGVVSLAGLWQLGKYLMLKKWVRVTLLFVVANIPMFLFLSSTINYDNLVILLSVWSIVISIKLIRGPDLFYLLALMSMSVFGPLVKTAFLPISAVLACVVLFSLVSGRQAYYSQLKASLRVNSGRIKLFVSILILLAALLLFAERYVGNLVRYQTITPTCDQVLSLSQCNENFVFSRGQIYKTAELAVPEVYLDTYLPQWVRIMMSRTYGILSHRPFTNNPFIINVSIVFFYLVIILSLKRPSKTNRDAIIIPFVFIMYTIALVSTNIGSYKESQELGLSVQGRYLLPVLLPLAFYAVGNLNAHRLNNTKMRNTLSGLVLVFAFYAGIPNILAGIKGNDWINPDLKELVMTEDSVAYMGRRDINLRK